MNKNEELKCILLDDAFQHRAVNAGLNILITEYNNLYIDDFVIPSGRLREFKTGSIRAHIIIISKCPKDISSAEKEKITTRIKPKNHQKIYFTHIEYGTPIAFNLQAEKIINQKIDSVLLLTGIANPLPLLEVIKSKHPNSNHLKFPDHHQFNASDIKTISEHYNKLNGNNKIIITTEKDIMRLSLPKIKTQLEKLPIFYIPIKINFDTEDKLNFDRQIIKYVTEN